MIKKLLFNYIIFIIPFYFNAQNLVAYYPFNGNANDESGNNHHGTTYNGVTLTQDKDGNPDSAYYFDGIDDYIDIDDWENGGAMSFTFWARWDAFNNYSRIIDLGNGSSSNNIIIANHQTNNGLFFSTYVSGETKLITANTITQSQWDFYAATFNINGLMTIYKNGSQINQKTDGIAPNLLLRTEQFIGKSNFSADGYFKGVIDELKIYNKTLTIEEIKNEYRCLVAFYPFNGNANDESGNSNNGTVNEAILTTDRFENANSAYEFDGVDDFIQVTNSNSLNIFNSDLTISMWLFNDNPLNDSSWKGISKGGYDTGTGYELIFTNDSANSNGKLGFNIGSSGYNVGSFNNYNNQWIMVTATYENGVRKVYINGIEQATALQGGDSFDSSSSDLYIGTRSPGNNYIGFVKGKIDDIRIYNSTLTSTEVLNLYSFNTLKIDKIENILESAFYVNNNMLHFKNTQNLNEIKTIEVYNLLGQKVFESSKIEKEISLEQLQQGIHILKVGIINGNYQTLKFIKP